MLRPLALRLRLVRQLRPHERRGGAEEESDKEQRRRDDGREREPQRRAEAAWRPGGAGGGVDELEVWRCARGADAVGEAAERLNTQGDLRGTASNYKGADAAPRGCGVASLPIAEVGGYIYIYIYMSGRGSGLCVMIVSRLQPRLLKNGIIINIYPSH